MSNVVKTDYVGKFKPEGDSVMNRILGFLSAEPAVRSMFTELLSDPCYEYVDAKLGMDVVAVSKDIWTDFPKSIQKWNPVKSLLARFPLKCGWEIYRIL